MKAPRTDNWFEAGWRILNDPEARSYNVFHTFINFCIIVSIAVVFYEVAARANDDIGRFLPITTIVDRVILVIFLAEYISRLIFIRNPVPRGLEVSPTRRLYFHVGARLRFIFSPWGLIDLSALLPIFPLLRSLRILRLLRLFRSAQFFRYHNPFTTLSAAFRDNALLFGVSLFLVVGVTAFSALMLYVAEFGENEAITGFEDTIWWAIVTITTVGYGDVSPTTAGGKVIGAGLMFAGMFVIAMFAGLVSSTLVGRLMPLRAEQVRMSSITDHIVVAGWNLEIPMMLVELEKEAGNAMPTVIVIADSPRPEELPAEYLFVRGQPTREAELEKVRIRYARTVLVVADHENHASPATRDAITVLTIFTIRSFEAKNVTNRKTPVHIVAEILDPENEEHARVAGADEVIETSRLGSSLMAHTATNPGIGSVMASLMLTTGANLYTDAIPTDLLDGEGMDFGGIRNRIRKQFNVIVIGFVHDGDLTLNPADDAPVYINDKLVYIGQDHWRAS